MRDKKISRREFLKDTAICSGLTSCCFSKSLLAMAMASNNGWVENPYEEVEWGTCKHICSTSHIHITTQKQLETAYSGGLRHFAPSNYYPSAPYYPLDKMREGQFKVKQEHQVVVKGHLKQGPFEWNEIILDKKNGWYEKLDADLQKNIPFKMGDYIFTNIPNDIVVSPNAEHHSFTNTRAHINSLGSMYHSGTFDVRNKYGLHRHGYSKGTAMKWQQTFDLMIKGLQFPAAGGITINHPLWSGLAIEQIFEMLDYDDRVLGLELWNETAERLKGQGFSIEMWDTVLATGRRCYGFSVPDHPKDKNYKGRNHLLVQEFNEKECLRAYRDGRFYCSLLGNGLKFDEISFSKGILSAKVNKQASIKFISDKGVVQKKGNSLTYKVPVEDGKFTLTYIRIEAEDGTGERIFSQPLMLKVRKKLL
jgi:hypothetical protein